jgi:hypothetical protein
MFRNPKQYIQGRVAGGKRPEDGERMVIESKDGERDYLAGRTAGEGGGGRWAGLRLELDCWAAGLNCLRRLDCCILGWWRSWAGSKCWAGEAWLRFWGGGGQ